MQLEIDRSLYMDEATITPRPDFDDFAARIARVYYGASDPKSGGVAHGARVFSHPQAHHAPEVYDGIAAEAAETLLKSFFAERR